MIELNDNELLLNGVKYKYAPVHPHAVKGGKDPVYLFWGIQWRQLFRRPHFQRLDTIQVKDQTFFCRKIHRSEIQAKPGIFHIFWNENWYEGQKVTR